MLGIDRSCRTWLTADLFTIRGFLLSNNGSIVMKNVRYLLSSFWSSSSIVDFGACGVCLWVVGGK